jgi:hypothetical protein
MLENKYTFDRNKQSEICWLDQKNKKHYYSNQIIDTCLKWLVEHVSKKRMEGK